MDKKRLIFFIVSGLSAVAFVTAAVGYMFFYDDLRRSLVHTYSQNARLSADRVALWAAEGMRVDSARPDQTIQSVQRWSDTFADQPRRFGLMDENGTILAFSEHSQLGQDWSKLSAFEEGGENRAIPLAEMLKAKANSFDGVIVTPDGVRQLISVAPIQNSGWRAISSVDYSLPRSAQMGLVWLLLKAAVPCFLGFLFAGGALTTFVIIRYERKLSQSKSDLERSVVERTDQLKLALSEQVEITDRLQRAQRLESLGRLAGGVAHDFNNLLTAINGYSDLALRRTDCDENLRRYLREIHKAGMRAERLTRQLLTFSRRQDTAPKVVNINNVILDIHKLLRRLIGDDIELTSLASSSTKSILVDPGQIEQVLINLAVNARDAMPDGGHLTVSTDHVAIHQAFTREETHVDPGQYTRLRVKDSGIGMSPEVRAHIFEPFFTTKPAGKGTGLGLATCYGIVKQNNGYIWVESEPGKGATFEVWFPAVEDAAVAPQAEVREMGELARGSERLLLVEDEPSVLRLMSRLLSRQGYEVLEAGNGVEAMRIAEEVNGQGIDLLVTDVVMPQMGGVELAERMRKKSKDVRILFTSGYSEEFVNEEKHFESESDFLHKPFTAETLSSKVREILDREAIPA